MLSGDDLDEHLDDLEEEEIMRDGLKIPNDLVGGPDEEDDYESYESVSDSQESDRSGGSTPQNRIFQTAARTPRSARRRSVNAAMLPGSDFPSSPERQNQTSRDFRANPRFFLQNWHDEASQGDEDEGSEDSDIYSDENDQSLRDYVQETETDDAGTEEESSGICDDSEAAASWAGGTAQDSHSSKEAPITWASCGGGIALSPFTSRLVFRANSYISKTADRERKYQATNGLSCRTWGTDFPAIERVEEHSGGINYSSGRSVEDNALATLGSYFLYRSIDRNEEDLVVEAKTIAISAAHQESLDFSRTAKDFVISNTKFFSEIAEGGDEWASERIMLGMSMWALALQLFYPAKDYPREHEISSRNVIELLLSRLPTHFENLGSVQIPVMLLKILLAVLESNMAEVQSSIESFTSITQQW